MRFRKNFSRNTTSTFIFRREPFQRWPVCRYYDGDGDGFRDHKGSGKSRRCDDRRDYARGRVLPIGGLKEKLLAAKKAGIHMVLVPEKNEPDVRELDAEITDGLQIEFVGSMEQVLKLALVEKK